MELQAVKFAQGGREAYAMSVSIADLLALIPERLDPNVIKDANRRLYAPHGKAFGEYVWGTTDWTCGAIMVGSPEDVVRFRPTRGGSNLGTVEIDDGEVSHLKLIDGQHRRYGLGEMVARERAFADALERGGDERAAREKRERLDTILNDSITVMLYVEDDMDALRQMFADISNVRPPDPITVVRFDRRNPFHVAAARLSDSHPLLMGRVEMERNTLTSKSNALLTLNQLSAVLRVLVAGVSGRVRAAIDVDADTIYDRGRAFFDDLLTASETVREIAEGEVQPIDLRDRGVLTINVTILKILAGVWRELTVIRDQNHEDVSRFIASMPEVPTAEETPFTRAGVLPRAEGKATPIARAQEMRAAVDEMVKEFAA